MEGEDKLAESFRKFNAALTDVDFKREFEELGLDLIIKNGGEPYSYRIYAASGPEAISYIDTGKLSVPDEKRKWLGTTKSHLEEMLEYNKSTMAVEVRVKLFDMLGGLKHLMDTNNPLFDEIDRRKYNLAAIKKSNHEQRDTFVESYKNGTMLNEIKVLGEYSNFFTGQEMNERYQTVSYDKHKNYMIMPLSHASQLVLSPDKDSASGFLGKIVTSRKGYSASIPLAEVSKLEAAELKSVVRHIVDMKQDQIDRIKKVREYVEERETAPVAKKQANKNKVTP